MRFRDNSMCLKSNQLSLNILNRKTVEKSNTESVWEIVINLTCSFRKFHSKYFRFFGSFWLLAFWHFSWHIFWFIFKLWSIYMMKERFDYSNARSTSREFNLSMFQLLRVSDFKYCILLTNYLKKHIQDHIWPWWISLRNGEFRG